MCAKLVGEMAAVTACQLLSCCEPAPLPPCPPPCHPTPLRPATVERTIQQLIGAGMDPRSENHPYLCFIYTSFQVWVCTCMTGVRVCYLPVRCMGSSSSSFRRPSLTHQPSPCPIAHPPIPHRTTQQERATKVSHGSTARMAAEHGDAPLARMCGLIAADESRHEAAYTRTMDAIFARWVGGWVAGLVVVGGRLRSQMWLCARCWCVCWGCAGCLPDCQLRSSRPMCA